MTGRARIGGVIGLAGAALLAPEGASGACVGLDGPAATGGVAVAGGAVLVGDPLAGRVRRLSGGEVAVAGPPAAHEPARDGRYGVGLAASGDRLAVLSLSQGGAGLVSSVRVDGPEGPIAVAPSDGFAPVGVALAGPTLALVEISAEARRLRVIELGRPDAPGVILSQGPLVGPPSLPRAVTRTAAAWLVARGTDALGGPTGFGLELFHRQGAHAPFRPVPTEAPGGLAPLLAAHGDAALIARGPDLLVVDAPTGAVSRGPDLSGGAPVEALALGARWIAAAHDGGVAVMERPGGPVRAVTLPVGPEARVRLALEGDLLAIAVREPREGGPSDALWALSLTPGAGGPVRCPGPNDPPPED